MKFYILLFVLFTFLFSCQKQQDLPKKDQVILAKIGDNVITVGDFQRDYETGFGFLKTGDDPKLTYLNHMINERVLASEGKRLGFGNSESIQRARQRLTNELMIEGLLEREIRSKIRITREEIQDEINKSKVSFKFRYWTEADYDRAKQISEDMKQRGYAEVVDDILQGNRETRINPKKFETDYLTHLEISEDLLRAIKDLPIGEISDPVNIDGKYFVIQVMDIRRSAVTTNEYISKASAFEQTIFYRKFQKRLHKYAGSLLEEKEIVTKRNSYQKLSRAIATWGELPDSLRKSFYETIQSADESQPELFALKKQLDKPFVEYKDGVISTEDFLPFFSVNRFYSRYKKSKDFNNTLHHLVAQSIRDYFLVAAAKDGDIIESAKLQKELDVWMSKWLFNESYNHFTSAIEFDSAKFQSFLVENANSFIDEEAAKTDFLRREKLNRLKGISADLKESIDIEINKNVLDTIKVVEFKKSRWATMQVFKSGTNHPALPNVDPVWDERHLETAKNKQK